MHDFKGYTERYPFNARVFYFGPRADIYTQDSERDHPHSHTLAVSKMTISWSRELGFDLIDAPKLTPGERGIFILKDVDEAQYQSPLDCTIL